MTVPVPIERCFDLLMDVGGYPSWYPEVVREVEVVELGDHGRPVRARARLHVAHGPLVRDHGLLLAVRSERPRSVELTRLPNEPSDPEQFEVSWRLDARAETLIELQLTASLSVPRFVPLGGIGSEMARGFVRAAAGALAGHSGVARDGGP